MLGSETEVQHILRGLDQSLKRNLNFNFLLFGHEKKIKKHILKFKRLNASSDIISCEDFVKMTDKPSEVIKSKVQTSMLQAIESVSNNISNAVLSFGNTGALMSLSLLKIKTQDDIKRPAIASIWPNLKGESIVLDLGANTKLDERYLVENAILGSSLASILFKINKPSIGLLNVGKEDTKGLETIKIAADELKRLTENSVLNYKGYVEGNDISIGKTNVVVTDGFTGNIALKTAEGTARLFQSHLKDAYKSSVISQIGYFLSSISMKSVKERLDPRVHNCGILMGLNSLVVKCHGQSEYKGVSYASDIIYSLLSNNVNERIKHYVRELKDKVNN
jgi:glycerol-3-phosphate acyltransferase PlsX